jgi:hypothetical protein
MWNACDFSPGIDFIDLRLFGCRRFRRRLGRRWRCFRRQFGDEIGELDAADVLHDLHHGGHGAGHALQEIGGVARAIGVAIPPFPDDNLVEFDVGNGLSRGFGEAVEVLEHQELERLL